jgi:hypothetical protein
VRHGRPRRHVFVDERLVLQLLPLRRREQPPPTATAAVPAQHHLPQTRTVPSVARNGTDQLALRTEDSGAGREAHSASDDGDEAEGV